MKFHIKFEAVTLSAGTRPMPESSTAMLLCQVFPSRNESIS